MFPLQSGVIHGQYLTKAHCVPGHAVKQHKITLKVLHDDVCHQGCDRTLPIVKYIYWAGFYQNVENELKCSN